MKRFALVCGLLLVAASSAAAQDKPFSMVGTWLLKGDGAAIGDSIHPEHKTGEAEPKVFAANLRYVIEKQSGTAFWGKSLGQTGTTEPLVGSLTKDAKHGVTVNARGGTINFVVVDANTIEGCYVMQTDAQHFRATCITGTRQ